MRDGEELHPENDLPENEENVLIEGRNAVTTAIKTGKTLDKVFIAGGKTDKTLRYIASIAREAGAAVVDCDRRKLDSMSQTGAHQGVIAAAAAWEYSSPEDMLETARQMGEKPLLIICDGITDPRNLGAIIRSAEVFGAHGVIIPKRRSAGLTGVVAKAAAGALERVPVAKVPNIPTLIETLKENGLWIYGAAAGNGTVLNKIRLTEPLAIVIGSEGDGLSSLTARRCDELISIPMRGDTGSLNASAAAAVVLYEVIRQRYVMED